MIDTDNGPATVMITPGGFEDRPLPKVSRRELSPSTWVNRTLRFSYVGADGIGVETSGISGEKTPLPVGEACGADAGKRLKGELPLNVQAEASRQEKASGKPGVPRVQARTESKTVEAALW